MSPMDQLELMERYTATHRAYEGKSREEREIACLRVLYPALFAQLNPTISLRADWIFFRSVSVA